MNTLSSEEVQSSFGSIANLVKGGASVSDFVIQSDTVFDNRTGLTWQRCPLGMAWSATHNRCMGQPQNLHFHDALRLALPDGWRVPSIAELMTLVQPHPEGQRQIDVVAFPDMAGTSRPFFWSSTLSGPQKAWCADFDTGTATDSFHPGHSFAVRLVRGGPSSMPLRTTES